MGWVGGLPGSLNVSVGVDRCGGASSSASAGYGVMALCSWLCARHDARYRRARTARAAMTRVSARCRSLTSRSS